ncbi:MAG: 3-hydroxyacyl-CoA dehydrogenase NAD-binding domain-containing protein, partial [Gammaproteobacteria bacterium]|nr:3-hydroxyacyl-CoA dehydrogenase NAD-binding domain-containing protein [Gammaproteobacteria bacterium]
AEAQQLSSTGVISAAEAEAILGRIDVLARVDAADRLQSADVVFEAVLEVLDIKQSTYAWLSEVCGAGTILASTTSTMLANTLAEFVTGPERFTNAHWLNPAYLMPLVEISPAAQTAPETVAKLRGLLEAVGKVPVVCKASPGYIVSRMQALVLNEAARLIEEGVASAEDVDQAIRTGFGPRYTVFGPLEFIDWGGGDILYYASNYLAEAIDKDRFSPPKIVRDNMAAGRNGMREGQGFYDWRDINLDDYRQERLAAFARLLGSLELLPSSADSAGPRNV